MVYRLITRGTIEERMIQMTKKKMVLEHLVVGRLQDKNIKQVNFYFYNDVVLHFHFQGVHVIQINYLLSYYIWCLFFFFKISIYEVLIVTVDC